MRWPIRLQLLFPTLSVVLLAIAVTAGAAAYYGGIQARERQEDSLRRLVATLASAQFPLSDSVLGQISGLSGAEFVLLDSRGKVRTTTTTIKPEERAFLEKTNPNGSPPTFAAGPRATVGGKVYLSRRVGLKAKDAEGRPGSLVVLYPQDREWAEMQAAAYPAILTGVIASAAVVLITTLLAHRFVRPIHALGTRAAAIAQGDFHTVEVPRRNDELRDLAISLNSMSERLAQYELDVRRSEQLRTLNQLGAGMAHQLRNAATGGRMAIELHRRACASGCEDETLEVALRQLRLMESYLQRFLDLGRVRAAAHENLDLAALVTDAIALVEPACVHAGVRIRLDGTKEPLAICGDADALRQVVVNMILNALDAIGGRPEEGRISVGLEGGNNGNASLKIRDTGPGPSADIVPRLFEPFATGKPEGTGLGLYVARQVVLAHRGTIDWRREGGETVFFITLPLAFRD